MESAKTVDSPEELSRRLVYLAAERTLTSWIRTALSLMALGFVVDRFDLVVREMLDAPLRTALHDHAVWRWSGSVLIGLGIAMAMASGAYYLRFALRYRRDGSTEVGHSMIFGALFTFMLGLGGIVVLLVIASALK